MLIGKMSREDIAEQMGVSLASLKRAFPGVRLAYFNRYVINPQLVRQVCVYYERHGKRATQERFPEVRVRSVVERYKQFRPRQVRWTDEQIIEAARMAGLVSYRAQAKYFNRPRANEGSIQALWQKRFGFGDGCINGLVKWHAKPLIRGGHSKYIRPVGRGRDGQPIHFRSLILWVDLERILKPNVPAFIVQAIRTMADFQRWLWRSDNPRPLILRMIRERECA